MVAFLYDGVKKMNEIHARLGDVGSFSETNLDFTTFAQKFYFSKNMIIKSLWLTIDETGPIAARIYSAEGVLLAKSEPVTIDSPRQLKECVLISPLKVEANVGYVIGFYNNNSSRRSATGTPHSVVYDDCRITREKDALFARGDAFPKSRWSTDNTMKIGFTFKNYDIYNLIESVSNGTPFSSSRGYMFYAPKDMTIKKVKDRHSGGGKRVWISVYSSQSVVSKTNYENKKFFPQANTPKFSRIVESDVELNIDLAEGEVAVVLGEGAVYYGSVVNDTVSVGGDYFKLIRVYSNSGFPPQNKDWGKENGSLLGLIDVYFSFKESNQPPTIPGNIQGIMNNGLYINGESIEINWDASFDPEGDAISYEIEFTVDGSNWYSLEKDIKVTSRRFNITNKDTDVAQFRVRAKDDKGVYSDYSYSAIFRTRRKVFLIQDNNIVKSFKDGVWKAIQ